MTEHKDVKVPKCPVCKGKKWKQVETIQTKLEVGRAGEVKYLFIVFECENCGQQRLDHWL